jgi:hypothetical protein
MLYLNEFIQNPLDVFGDEKKNAISSEGQTDRQADLHIGRPFLAFRERMNCPHKSLFQTPRR